MASSYTKNDGLNLYLYTEYGAQTTPFIAGAAPGTGTNVCWARFPFTLGTDVHKHAPAHELGHCLSLYHTFESAANPKENVERDEMGTCFNCKIAGDKCCDTPADPQIGNVVNCIWASTDLIDDCQFFYVNVDVKNIMSYFFGCTEHFTNDQGMRMRDYINGTSGIQVQTQVAISSNTTWTSPVNSVYDIRIKAPYKLTIQSTTLAMAPNRKIVIEPGAD